MAISGDLTNRVVTVMCNQGAAAELVALLNGVDGGDLTIADLVCTSIVCADSSLDISGLTSAAGVAGGAVVITAGSPVSGNAVGGAASVTGGGGSGTGNGGVASVIGGDGGGGLTGNGGGASVAGGSATSTNGNGGGTTLAAGDATGTGTAGSASLTGGASGGASGTAGSVSLTPGSASGGTVGAVNIGGAAANKVGFHGATAVVQAAHVADVATTGVYADDDDAIVAAINAISLVLSNLGLTAA